MREILFRGKRKDNGEWVEGYLIAGRPYSCDNEEVCIVPPSDPMFFPRCEISIYYDVIPETVGQYTGLVDANGKKIFEGDIVTDHTNKEIGDIMPIKFGRHKISCCGCCYSWHDAVGFYADTGYKYISSYEERWDDFKVIGNIHDNPELLEKGEQK